MQSIACIFLWEQISYEDRRHTLFLAFAFDSQSGIKFHMWLKMPQTSLSNDPRMKTLVVFTAS